MSWAHGKLHIPGSRRGDCKRACEHFRLNFQEWPPLGGECRFSTHSYSRVQTFLILRRTLCTRMFHGIAKGLLFCTPVNHWLWRGFLWVIHSLFLLLIHIILSLLLFTGLCILCPASYTLFSQIPIKKLPHFHLLPPPNPPDPSVLYILSCFIFSYCLTSDLCFFMFPHFFHWNVNSAGPRLHLLFTKYQVS